MGQRSNAVCTDVEFTAAEDGWIDDVASPEELEVVLSGASNGHQRVAAVLMGELNRHFDAALGNPGGWWIHYRPEVHLGGEVQMPDLAGWRRERLPVQPGPTRRILALAPDWVCEVLLPNTAAIDRGRKMSGYQRVGVRCVWLIDPASRTVEVFLRDGEGWELLSCFRGDAVARAEPFDEVALELGRLWLPEESSPAHLL
jgi:Uma2 family endonuclease